MRKNLLLIASLCCGLLASSCVNLQKIRQYPQVVVDVPGKYLRETDRQVDVRFDAGLAEQYSSWNTGIILQPLFIGPDSQQLVMPPMIVEGWQHGIFNKRMARYESKYADRIADRHNYQRHGTLAEYAHKVRYEDWMRGAGLYADLYADAFKERVHLGRIPITCGLLDFRQFIRLTPDEGYYYRRGVPVARMVRGGEAVPKEWGKTFRFDSPEMMDQNGVWNELAGYVNSLKLDPEVQDYVVRVTVSNSPEGSLDYNRELGVKRLDAMKHKLAMHGIPFEKCHFVTIDEGWQALYELLPSLGLRNADQIAAIIRDEPDADRRERMIRTRYGADYRKMVREAYPKLRYGETIVTARYKGIEGEIYRHADAEFGLPAMNGELISLRQLPAGSADVPSLAAAMLDAVKAGDYKRAEQIADRIPNAKADATVRYDKALVFIKAGRTAEAKALLKGLGDIPESRYNLGLLQLLDGEYGQAADNMAGYIDINAAVAQLYAGRDQQAADILLLSDGCPERDYLLAVAYARLGRTGQARQYLDRALQASPALRAKAACEPDLCNLDAGTR